MPQYRRLYVPGGTYVFTVNLANRRTDLLTRNIEALRAAIARTKTDHPFTIDAVVVLPDHLHAIWTFPPDDTDFSTRWSLIKRRFSAAIPNDERRSPSRIAKAERGIWQRRFWDHALRDATDVANHTDYIHFNPVKHGLAAHPAAWPFSSFHRAVARGEYPPDWAKPANQTDSCGEREPELAPIIQTPIR